ASGSDSVIRRCPPHVRFDPTERTWPDYHVMSQKCHKETRAGAAKCMERLQLLDDLVGALLKEQRNIEAERLGGLNVDGHLKFGRQWDGKLGRLCAKENAIDVGC